jgi:CcmD family protein
MSTQTSTPEPSAHPTDDRATTFQAVQGAPEHYSGEVLLVTAYAVLWLIVFAFVVLAWRRQNRINARLDALEREIDKADAKSRT